METLGSRRVRNTRIPGHSGTRYKAGGEHSEAVARGVNERRNEESTKACPKAFEGFPDTRVQRVSRTAKIAGQ